MFFHQTDAALTGKKKEPRYSTSVEALPLFLSSASLRLSIHPFIHRSPRQVKRKIPPGRSFICLMKLLVRDSSTLLCLSSTPQHANGGAIFHFNTFIRMSPFYFSHCLPSPQFQYISTSRVHNLHAAVAKEVHFLDESMRQGFSECKNEGD